MTLYYVHSDIFKTSVIFSLQTALIGPNNDEFEILIETVQERTIEGQGETIYEIGTGGK